MADRFSAIKAQLDNISAALERDEAGISDALRAYRSALIEIAQIKADDHGNGFRLAVAVAEKVLNDVHL